MLKIAEKDVVSVWKNYTAGKVFYWGNDTIEIIYPGRASNAGGCDLKDAVFSINGKICTGDVEVHTRGGDWYKHGHSVDSRYNDIALHVVAIDDTGSITRTSLGKNIPLINIGDLIEHIYSERIIKYKKETYFKCPATSNYSNHSSINEYLRTIGIHRFKIRVGKFCSMLEIGNPEQVLYHSICRCLGYEKNTEPFEKLADNLNISKLQNLNYQSKLQLMSFIIGSAGLLPVQTNKNSAVYNSLSVNQINEMENFWLEGKYPQILYDGDWCFFRIRPANNPVRRLIALTEIVYRYRKEGLVERMTSLILNTNCNKVSNMERELSISWESVYTDSSGKSTRLLGKNKIRQIIINTILPFLFAYGLYTGHRELSYKAKSLYSNFPGLEDNHLISYMRGVLMISSKWKPAAVEQQGLIYLFNKFCRNKDCRRCTDAMKVMSVREQHQDRNFRFCSSVS